jgi:similar to stage IV sporulation protein
MIRYIKSFIEFKVIKGDGNSLINIAKNYDIKIWDIKKIDNIFYAKCYKSDYVNISRKAKTLRIKLKVLSKRGIYFKAKKYNKRIGLLIGLIFLLSIITFLQNFIWTLEINIVGDNTNLITLTDFKKYGIKKGAFLPLLDFKQIENKIYKQNNDISWISINRIGTRVCIEIRPRVIPPELIKDKKPCNIIAKRGGKILKIETYYGQKQVVVGDYVAQGELLISGIIDNPDMTTSIMYSNGKVIALTEISNIIKINEKNTNENEIKNQEKRFENSLGEIKILSKKTQVNIVDNQTIVTTDYSLEENIAMPLEIKVFS